MKYKDFFKELINENVGQGWNMDVDVDIEKDNKVYFLIDQKNKYVHMMDGNDFQSTLSSMKSNPTEYGSPEDYYYFVSEIHTEIEKDDDYRHDMAPEIYGKAPHVKYLSPKVPISSKTDVFNLDNTPKGKLPTDVMYAINAQLSKMSERK